MNDMHVERIGLATLYLGKWQEIPDLPYPAAVISDPPYGQSVNTNVRRGDVRIPKTGGGAIKDRAHLYPSGIYGDDEPFDPKHLISMSEIVLLWGAHKFAGCLPQGSWLCWDKMPTGKIRSQGDGECAWINTAGRPMRIFRHLWDGLCISSGYETQCERSGQAAVSRVHPTQKPVDLMAWCIEQARVPKGGLILDPYMGGGSTGIAAVRAGHPFIGVECEPQYFEAACRRLKHAQATL
ncbi:cytosine-specific DNA methylase [Komagataeibacter europaeus NBRC 3261]|uniref:Methyltransferase n=1 Tax=Komagataeibacter europaeus NBRC 3261 TaxID=1234669 RepID=A0A0D6PWF7_KOMEU|nr:DNA methyltransferase [Komagataeibacter europaeus]GAN95353.1 cytosine-specific DNA methylase [Komagataeibacter europaeus NBRC 3261]